MAEEYKSQVRVVLVPFDCESDTKATEKALDRYDYDYDAASNGESELESDTDLQEFINPSQNNNAKRSRVNSSSPSSINNRNRHHSRPMHAPDGNDRTLFPKIIRTEDSEEHKESDDANVPLRVRRSISRDNLLFDDFGQVGLPIRPALSLAEMPHPLQSRRDRHGSRYSRRKTSEDILDEWRREGLLKERSDGIAFDIHLPSLPQLAPSQKPKRIHRHEWLTRHACSNLEFDADSFMQRMDAKQQRASDRRNQVSSSIKERVAQLQQRTKYVKENYDEDEYYKQRTANMRIIEKQSQCAANRERQENESRQRIREERRRRDKVRKRAKRKKKQSMHELVNVISDRLDERDGSFTNLEKQNDDPGDEPEVYEYSDDFEESSPRTHKYYSEFGY